MGGKPAARVTDMHTCPKTTAQVPHVGGPVVQGSSNVFINGRPAARVGDMAICHGPPDRITKGSPTVFINGKPAARMGDRTEHGGVIIKGSNNVFIGDGSGPSESCPLQAADAGAAFYSQLVAGPAPARSDAAGVSGGNLLKGMTQLGEQTEQIMSRSSTATKELKALQEKKWVIKYGTQSPSVTNAPVKEIDIDPHYKDDPVATSNQLSHELGHAMNPSVLDMSSKQAFLNGQLDGEGAATVNNIAVRREILANGGPDIYIAGSPENIPKYEAVYEASTKSGDMNAAYRSIGKIYGQNEMTGSGVPYNKYYGDYYDAVQ